MNDHDPRPSQLLRGVRQQFAAGTGVFVRAAPEHPAAAASYCDDIADWLLGLLPGADIAQVGWGTFAVASIHIVHSGEVPIKDQKQAAGRGADMSAWLACAVGDRLIAQSAHADAQPLNHADAQPLNGVFEPGAQLREIQSLSREAVESMVGLASSPQARDEFCARTRMTLLGQVPGLDPVLTGWAVMATGTRLTHDARRLLPQPAGLAAALQGKRKTAERTGFVYGSTVLAMIGDYLSRDHPGVQTERW